MTTSMKLQTGSRGSERTRAHAHTVPRRINVRPAPNAVRHVDQLSIVDGVCGPLWRHQADSHPDVDKCAWTNHCQKEWRDGLARDGWTGKCFADEVEEISETRMEIIRERVCSNWWPPTRCRAQHRRAAYSCNSAAEQNIRTKNPRETPKCVFSDQVYTTTKRWMH